jgi:site-specific DNA-methyltransferase (adenine-specific)
VARLTKLFKSDSTEWETPGSIFDPLNKEFNFTLDVAASAQNAKCRDFLTKDDDGLSVPWSGVCWCNPPYGRGMKDWLWKAAVEMARGATTVALIPARTNTEWFHEICFRLGEVRFVRGRHKFGDSKHGLPWPLAVVIFPRSDGT